MFLGAIVRTFQQTNDIKRLALAYQVEIANEEKEAAVEGETTDSENRSELRNLRRMHDQAF